ncbi:pyridoxal-phosphate dependent enzyme [Streptomyces canus]|uniref:pyridoxal-phosphate dependent enzyme n=1 Tax=Streptomyces canus TaxID=58343 RepID=UPI0033A4556B
MPTDRSGEGDRAVVVDTYPGLLPPRPRPASATARRTASGPRRRGRRLGGTPLVRLSRVVPDGAAEVLVKVEGGNPTGSYKDRMALAIIEGAERRGKLAPGQRVVEFTGGSTSRPTRAWAATAFRDCSPPPTAFTSCAPSSRSRSASLSASTWRRRAPRMRRWN